MLDSMCSVGTRNPRGGAPIRIERARGWRRGGPNVDYRLRATFSEPGNYVLRARASNGGLIDYEDVTITVTR